MTPHHSVQERVHGGVAPGDRRPGQPRPYCEQDAILSLMMLRDLGFPGYGHERDWDELGTHARHLLNAIHEITYEENDQGEEVTMSIEVTIATRFLMPEASAQEASYQHQQLLDLIEQFAQQCSVVSIGRVSTSLEQRENFSAPNMPGTWDGQQQVQPVYGQQQLSGQQQSGQQLTRKQQRQQAAKQRQGVSQRV